MALAGAAVFIPLLQRCGTEASVQAARFPDPSRPPLKAGLSVPSLRFHLSPGRVRRIMRILRSALPGTTPIRLAWSHRWPSPCLFRLVHGLLLPCSRLHCRSVAKRWAIPKLGRCTNKGYNEIVLQV